ncbi:TDT family transporter [Planosporangium mesophilum]|uniref:Dicarboxylate transporter/tellurite-resistance protein TehA n=1 Tax=Planosporangium mesophilum TaxID=689768 RepID=A0A8J3TAW6_9ACTN|nr:TDT family transporter [Planosporangium mesophilum]NJC85308.1 TDT family transporter [Planosporangium mesophilum]GII23233.1 dicarboxylate transporter/tellurite-resistance protein TehA [Planosporangium mesophilum]
MTTRTARPQVGITPNMFGIAYGMAGLAVCWGYAAMLGLAPAVVADVLFILTAVVWLALVVGYLSQVPRRRGGWRAELTDPVLGPFVSLIPIVGMLLAIGLLPHASAAGRWLFAIFAAATTVLAGWMTGQWIVEDLDLDTLHSGYVLPAVAGGLIASIGAALAGWTGLAHAFMGLGVLSWLLIGSVIMARLMFRAPLPRPLKPTLAIEVAPPALAGLAYLAITHGRVDLVALALGGFTALAVIVQLRLIPVYRRLAFGPAFWSFAFPYAAVATFALHWINYGRPVGYKIWAWVVLLAITAFIAALAAETTAALARRRFLPQLR